MKNVSLLPLAAALILIGGCASSGPTRMSANDCATSDWRAVGLDDGLAGESRTRRDARATTCAENSAAADLAAYDVGYAEGNNTFCQPKGGYEHGLEGKQYQFVCSDELEPMFVFSYEVGYGEYEIKQALRDADRDLNKMERNMRTAQEDVQRLERQYNSATTSADQMRVRNEVAALRRRISTLQQQRVQFRFAQDAAQQALKKYRKNRPEIPGVEYEP